MISKFGKIDESSVIREQNNRRREQSEWHTVAVWSCRLEMLSGRRRCMNQGCDAINDDDDDHDDDDDSKASEEL